MRQGKARWGVVRRGEVGRVKARQGKARLGSVWYGLGGRS